MGCGAAKPKADNSSSDLHEWIFAAIKWADEFEESFQRDGLITVVVEHGSNLHLPLGGAVKEVAEAVYSEEHTVAAMKSMKSPPPPIHEDVSKRILQELETDPMKGQTTTPVTTVGLGVTSPSARTVVHGKGGGAEASLTIKYSPSCSPVTLEVPDEATLYLPKGCIEGVVMAEYGTEEAWCDVRSRVIKPLLYGNRLLVRSDVLDADPCPGKKKRLRVSYIPRHPIEKRQFTGDQRLVFEVLSPWLFAEVRSLLNVTHATFSNSIHKRLAKREMGLNGWVSRDRRFVIKTVTKDDMMTLLGLMPAYKKHLEDYPQTLLPRYVGAYRINRSQDQVFVVVTLNCFAAAHGLNEVFALNAGPGLKTTDANGKNGKGVPPTARVQRDSAFSSITVHVDDSAIDEFQDTLRRDVAFLEKYDITDYCLVLGFASALSGGEEGVTNIGSLRGSMAGSSNKGSIKAMSDKGSAETGEIKTEEKPRKASERRSKAALQKSKSKGFFSKSSVFGSTASPIPEFRAGTVLSGIKAEGVIDRDVKESMIFITLEDTLSSFGLHEPVKLRIGEKMDESARLPAGPFARRFVEHFNRKIRGRSERMILEPRTAEVFELPLPGLGRSGGTAAFFQVKYLPGCAANEARNSDTYWVGKDLARSREEVLFYEHAKHRIADPKWGILKWTLDYGGICRAPALKTKGGKAESVDVLLIRNARDGYKSCRLVDIKVGVKTAVAGWQGKSAWAAWRQACIDSHTSSAGQGFRLEGFDSPPQTLKSFEALISEGNSFKMAANTKQLLRFNLQRMTAVEFLPFFLDLHGISLSPGGEPPSSTHLTRIEHQELVLLTCIEELAGFVSACRHVAIPQQWIGSSVMLAFDCATRPARAALLPGRKGGDRGVCRVNIFDWGKSVLNLEHMHDLLTEHEKSQREEYWGYYCGGIAKLLYDCCFLYVSRFWHEPKSLVFALWDKDRYSDNDFIGYMTAPLEAVANRKSTLRKLSGEAVKSGMISSQETSMQVSVQVAPDNFFHSEKSRLESPWLVRVESAFNVPRMDYISGTDSFVEVVAVPDTQEEVAELLKEKPSTVSLLVTEGSHPTTLFIDGKNPKWADEFEMATLKPEMRRDVVDALTLALGRKDKPVTAAEMDAWFPRSCIGIASTQRSSLQTNFAQQCFPRIKVDPTSDAPTYIDQFPDGDLLRMLHFAQWLVSEGRHSESIFVLLLMALSKEGAMDSLVIVSFYRVIVDAHDRAAWVVELQEVFAPVAGGAVASMASHDVSSAEAQNKTLQPEISQGLSLLISIAKHELRDPWSRYNFQNQMADFHLHEAKAASVPTTSEPPTRSEMSSNRLRQTMAVGNMLMSPSARQDGSITSTAMPNQGKMWFSAATTPQDKLSLALPIMVEAVVSFHQSTDELRQSVREQLNMGTPTCLASRRTLQKCCFSVPARGCKYTASPGTIPLVFEAYGASLLRTLRHATNGMSDDELLEEFCDINRGATTLSTNSKSGQIFFVSGGGRCIIKTITDGEAKALLDLLPEYCEHITLAQGESLLVRYLFLLRLDLGSGYGETYVTVMRSVFDTGSPISAMYDLKGSTLNRVAKAGEKVRKDEDWVKDGQSIRLPPESLQRIAEAHQRDCNFLQRHQFMDFSVLVGIAQKSEDVSDRSIAETCWLGTDPSEMFFVGIIDFLVEYGLRKRMEAAAYEFVGKTGASCVDPQRYCARQVEFFQQKMLKLQNVASVPSSPSTKPRPETETTATGTGTGTVTQLYSSSPSSTISPSASPPMQPLPPLEGTPEDGLILDAEKKTLGRADSKTEVGSQGPSSDTGSPKAARAKEASKSRKLKEPGESPGIDSQLSGKKKKKKKSVKDGKDREPM